MVSLALLQPFLQMPRCNSMLSCCLGLVSRTYVRMVEYLRRFSLKERNGRIQRTLMKCLVQYTFPTFLNFYLNCCTLLSDIVITDNSIFISLQLSMKFALRMEPSLQNLRELNSPLKRVCYLYFYRTKTLWGQCWFCIFNLISTYEQVVSALHCPRLLKQWRRGRRCFWQWSHNVSCLLEVWLYSSHVFDCVFLILLTIGCRWIWGKGSPSFWWSRCSPTKCNTADNSWIGIMEDSIRSHWWQEGYKEDPEGRRGLRASKWWICCQMLVLKFFKSKCVLLPMLDCMVPDEFHYFASGSEIDR